MFFKYTLYDQFKDIFPIYLLMIPLVIVLVMTRNLDLSSNILNLIVMVLTGIIVYTGTAYLMKSIALTQIKEVLLPYLKNRKK